MACIGRVVTPARELGCDCRAYGYSSTTYRGHLATNHVHSPQQPRKIAIFSIYAIARFSGGAPGGEL